MRHEMRLDPAPFAAIARGAKTVEMRLFDEKRRQISVGDEILFLERGGTATLRTEVVALHIFPSFRELYAAFPKAALGYGDGELAAPSDMEKYYSAAEQKTHGVVGIEVKCKQNQAI